jgi:hypothetical protein
MAKKKKIVVEFEFTPEQVQELIEAGGKGPGKISKDEVLELTKKGTIRASDYLTKDQLDLNASLSLSFVSKIGKKIVSKAQNKVVQKVAVSTAVTIVSSSAPEEGGPKK